MERVCVCCIVTENDNADTSDVVHVAVLCIAIVKAWTFSARGGYLMHANKI